MIFLHLKPTDEKFPKVKLIDKIGFERRVDLDDVVFLIQRKGETFETRLNDLFKEEKIEEVKQTIDQVVQMYLSEYSKGIYDHDREVLSNSGFIDNQPFHLDVGQLVQDQRIKNVLVYRDHLKEMLWVIYVWVEKKFPQQSEMINHFLAEEYFKSTGDKLDFEKVDPQVLKRGREQLLLDHN